MPFGGLLTVGIGAAAGVGGNILQGSANKKAAKRANRLSPAQLEILARSQRVSAATEKTFMPFLSGRFDAREARRQRDDAKFLSDLSKRAGEEALRSNLSFLVGTGVVGGRAAKLQARGAAEIARTQELTARQVLQQNRDREFAQKVQAAQILQGFVGGGQAIANRPRQIAADTTGQALAGLGGQIAGAGLGFGLGTFGPGAQPGGTAPLMDFLGFGGKPGPAGNAPNPKST